MNVEDFVYKAQQGDKLALEEVLTRYKPFILKKAKFLYICDMDIEDFIEEGYVSVMKAMTKYNSSKNDAFTPYVKRTIENNYSDVVRKNARYNTNTSMQKPLGQTMELMDTFKDQLNIEDDYIHKEDLMLLEKVKEKLSPQELENIKCFFNSDGITLRQISKDRKISYSTLTKQKGALILKVKRLFESL